MSRLIKVLGDSTNQFYRSALAGNAGVYDGINDYDFSSDFVNSLSLFQPFTVLQAYWLQQYPPSQYYVMSTRHITGGKQGWTLGAVFNTGQLVYYGVANGSARLQGFLVCKE